MFLIDRYVATKYSNILDSGNILTFLVSLVDVKLVFKEVSKIFFHRAGLRARAREHARLAESFKDSKMRCKIHE